MERNIKRLEYFLIAFWVIFTAIEIYKLRAAIDKIAGSLDNIDSRMND